METFGRHARADWRRLGEAGLVGFIEALRGFYQAFNGRDLALMERVWAHTDDAQMNNPVGGIVRGWPAIRALYVRIFSGPAVVEVEFHDYTLRLTPHMGYVAGRERGTATVGARRLDLAIRTSRVFERIDGAWRLVHHHGSIDDPAILEAYQRLLRGGAAAP